jgi:hypothetical protein
MPTVTVNKKIRLFKNTHRLLTTFTKWIEPLIFSKMFCHEA